MTVGKKKKGKYGRANPPRYDIPSRIASHHGGWLEVSWMREDEPCQVEV